MLDFLDVAPPAPGAAATVAPGLWWLRMELPFALDHINLWLTEEAEQGWGVVDTGFADDRTRALWEQLFTGVMRGHPLTRLIATHFHPDHLGLAAWLEARFAVPLETTLGEWAFGRALCLDDSRDHVDATIAFYRGAGMDDAAVAAARRRGNVYRHSVPAVPVNFVRLRDGDVLSLAGRRWRVVIGEGHSVEQACLWCEQDGLLIAGDQILPSITPNVGVWPTEPKANPLKEFFQSLERFRSLPAETLVLPSHGLPFRGLRQRVDALVRHHQERLERCLTACRQPATATELLPTLFQRPLDSFQTSMAVGEALAHLHYLVETGEMVADTDAGGVHRFRCR